MAPVKLLFSNIFLLNYTDRVVFLLNFPISKLQNINKQQSNNLNNKHDTTQQTADEPSNAKNSMSLAGCVVQTDDCEPTEVVDSIRFDSIRLIDWFT